MEIAIRKKNGNIDNTSTYVIKVQRYKKAVDVQASRELVL